MPLRLYGLKTCATCRAALAALPEAEFVDVRPGLPPETLRRFHEAFGDALVNRRSTTWRGLSEEERGGAPLALLAAHPTLMKRPVIEADGALHLGWSAETRAVFGAD